jgi:branched-chain amino acid transport system substrate-binding protein
MLNAYNGVSAQINYIKSQLKAGETMADLKIAIVYLDGAYGRGVFAPLELMQEQNGFELVKIPVAHPGLDQRAQWQQIRRAKVDWVLFRTWGAMTPVAIKTAARTGFPTDRLIGDIWSGGESDVIPAGEAGIGYTAITTYPAGTDFSLIQEIKKKYRR